jgi:5'(3')-deoxyribonucleotidase
MNIAPHEIAFDFDGVVADTFKAFVAIAKKDYDIDIKYEAITNYEILKVININREISDKIIETITLYPHELDLQPNKGVSDVLSRMTSINHSPILVVTARPLHEPVALWFEKHLPDIAPHVVIKATSENTKKLGVLKEHDIKYFVDDRLDTCEMLGNEGITPIVYEQPWNRQPHNFQIVRDWEDISKLIRW